MADATDPEPEADDEGIMIVAIKDNHYLAMGEAHMQAMLAGDAPYPTPIACVAFRDMAHLTEHVETGLDGLWAIHPDVIARLRRKGEILDKVID